MKKFKLTYLIITLCLVFAATVYAAEGTQTLGVKVGTPSQSEICDFILENPILLGADDSVQFDATPSIQSPYKLGQVSASYLEEGVNTVNIIRYIAGLPANVTLNKKYNESAQAAALVCAANGEISHTPSKPLGMDSNLYQKGYQGAGNSNLAQGFNLLSQAIVGGYMNDGDSSNIAALGHRRWMLNPQMQKTGFGFTQNDFSAMYTWDNLNAGYSDAYSVVPWPAQNTPVEIFDTAYPFSLSLSGNFNELSRKSISIKMVRESDGKIWNFNSSSSSKPESQGYFNVNNIGCGQPRCIIWRPAGIESYNGGDRYAIQISGVKKNGQNYPINYNVAFFNTASYGLKIDNTLLTCENNIAKDFKVLGTSSSASNVPHILKSSLTSEELIPGDENFKMNVQVDKASSLYCKIYDSENNLILTRLSGAKLAKAGAYSIKWKGVDANGNPLDEGNYKIQLYLKNEYGTSASKYMDVTIQSEKIEGLSYNVGIKVKTMLIDNKNYGVDGNMLKKYMQVELFLNADNTTKYNIARYNPDGTRVVVMADGSEPRKYDFNPDMEMAANCPNNAFTSYLRYDDSPKGKYRIDVYLWNEETGENGVKSVYFDMK